MAGLLSLSCNLALITAVSVAAQQQAQQAAHDIGLEKERVIGRQYIAELTRLNERVTDSEIEIYANTIAARLTAGLRAARFAYKVLVIDDAYRSRPLPVPGGTIVLPVAAITTASDEVALTTALAHAIAHIELRHGLVTAARTDIGNSGAIPLLFLPPCLALGPAGYRQKQTAEESVADQFARDLITRTAAEPNSATNFAQIQSRVQTLLEAREIRPAPTLRRANSPN